MKYGIRSISMDDIARELGMSKKTLYQFVSSKADLVQKILESNELHSKCFDHLDQAEMNAIDELLSISIQVAQDLKKYNPAVLYDLQKYYPEIIRPFFDRRRKAVLLFTIENLHKGIRQNIYRDDLAVDLVAKLYVNKLEGVHDFMFSGDQSHTYEHILNVMFDNHIRGIANDNGIQYYESQKNKYQY